MSRCKGYFDQIKNFNCTVSKSCKRNEKKHRNNRRAPSPLRKRSKFGGSEDFRISRESLENNFLPGGPKFFSSLFPEPSSFLTPLLLTTRVILHSVITLLEISSFCFSMNYFILLFSI
ncbi:hypothetical protein ASJ81_15795 [Methanosarcina spelaei]|uniref:Uncharacterized protein n=1 Tax=Methanosarcina spelaei TaxID=1036679 RepID=A0A2A2HWW2_9EURY|nr:hypothetical protein ASJ81_15795 [Methanosarcina spelaei]